MSTDNRPWCTDSGHAPKAAHDASSVCALAWELGITAEDNPDEMRELKRAVAHDRREA